MAKFASKEQLTSLVADMASKINIASGTQGVSGSYVPIGCIEAFMGVSAPPDFLACDGSLHSIASYPQLADHFYEQFGASNYFGGNGTTTFAVPDLRGEFLRGTGTNGHANQGSGANAGEHQDGTIIDYVASDGQGGIYYPFNGVVESTNKKHDYVVDTNKLKYTNSAGASGGSSFPQQFTSRPTNTSVLWCIKAIDQKFDPEIQMVKYSTDEQLIGTWIDGKKLYKKTIDLGALPNTTETIINHGIGNIDKIISYAGFATDGNEFVDLPYVSGSDMVSIWLNRSQILCSAAWDASSWQGILTIKYTKTT